VDMQDYSQNDKPAISTSYFENFAFSKGKLPTPKQPLRDTTSLNKIKTQPIPSESTLATSSLNGVPQKNKVILSEVKVKQNVAKQEKTQKDEEISKIF
jgi:hypothetical protein